MAWANSGGELGMKMSIGHNIYVMKHNTTFGSPHDTQTKSLPARIVLPSVSSLINSESAWVAILYHFIHLAWICVHVICPITVLFLMPHKLW